MKMVLAVLFLGVVAPALADDQAALLSATKTMVAQMAPLGDCLKKAIEDGKPGSREEALAIARAACVNVAFDIRPKMLDAFRRADLPLPATVGDPEKLVDWTIDFARVKAFMDFTGELKRLNDPSRAAAAKSRLYRDWRLGDP